MSAEASPETVLLSWRTHRLLAEPQRIALIALGYGIAFALWRWLLPHPLALFLPLIALTSALAEFVLPVEFRLTERGAHADCGPLIKLFLSWSDVKRATHGTEGIHLSPLARPSRLDAFRGVRLRFGESNREAILALVRERLRLAREEAA